MNEKIKYCHNCGRRLDAGLVCETCGLEFREEKEEEEIDPVVKFQERFDERMDAIEAKIDAMIASQKCETFVERVAKIVYSVLQRLFRRGSQPQSQPITKIVREIMKKPVYIPLPEVLDRPAPYFEHRWDHYLKPRELKKILQRGKEDLVRPVQKWYGEHYTVRAHKTGRI